MPVKKPTKEKVEPKVQNSALPAGTKIKFHYTGKLETGEIFDKSEGRPPLEFETGKGMIIPGLEKEIVKMKVSEKKTIKVARDDAYGPSSPELIREMPKGPIPPGMKLEVGTVLYLKTPDGQPIPVAVKEVKEDTVVLDFNHPLAGKNLIFEVEVVGIN